MKIEQLKENEVIQCNSEMIARQICYLHETADSKLFDWNKHSKYYSPSIGFFTTLLKDMDSYPASLFL